MRLKKSPFVRICITASLVVVSLVVLTLSEPQKAEPVESKCPHGLLMGFTTWPHDLTQKAADENYKFISENGTMIAHHIDGGVPWQEALEDGVFPRHLRNEWDRRVRITPPGHKIFLAITPLNFERSGLAPNWGDAGDNRPLPKDWKKRSLNSPEVKQAYLNYALRAVAKFNPDYLAIGIETNIIISRDPDRWNAYLELHKFVYERIKQSHPQLPVFATVQYEHLRGIEDISKANKKRQKPAVSQLMDYSDLMALSSYRYGFLHPNPPTEDYFDLALSFGKPVAIAEMGAMSKPTVVLGMPLPSSEDNQAEFVEMTLKAACTHKFPFVVHWLARDFDPMVKKLPPEFAGISKAWVHSGLLHDNGRPKKAYKIWRSFLPRSED